MPLKSYPYLSYPIEIEGITVGDRAYGFREERLRNQMLFTQGVDSRYPDAYRVKPVLNKMQVSVNTAKNALAMTPNGVFAQGELNEEIVSVSPAHPTLPRTDIIAVFSDDTEAERRTRLIAIAGVPAAMPIKPSVPASALPLAEIAVPAGALQPSSVTDLRGTSACGFIMARDHAEQLKAMQGALKAAENAMERLTDAEEFATRAASDAARAESSNNSAYSAYSRALSASQTAQECEQSCQTAAASASANASSAESNAISASVNAGDAMTAANTAEYLSRNALTHSNFAAQKATQAASSASKAEGSATTAAQNAAQAGSSASAAAQSAGEAKAAADKAGGVQTVNGKIGANITLSAFDVAVSDNDYTMCEYFYEYDQNVHAINYPSGQAPSLIKFIPYYSFNESINNNIYINSRLIEYKDFEKINWCANDIVYGYIDSNDRFVITDIKKSIIQELWINKNAGVFEPQTIYVANDNYNYIAITILEKLKYNSKIEPGETPMMIYKINLARKSFFSFYNFSIPWHYMDYRTISLSKYYDNGIAIEFFEARHCSFPTDSTIVDNAAAVPYRIFGIKG